MICSALLFWKSIIYDLPNGIMKFKLKVFFWYSSNRKTKKKQKTKNKTKQKQQQQKKQKQNETKLNKTKTKTNQKKKTPKVKKQNKQTNKKNNNNTSRWGKKQLILSAPSLVTPKTSNMCLTTILCAMQGRYITCRHNSVLRIIMDTLKDVSDQSWSFDCYLVGAKK